MLLVRLKPVPEWKGPATTMRGRPSPGVDNQGVEVYNDDAAMLKSVFRRRARVRIAHPWGAILWALAATAELRETGQRRNADGAPVFAGIRGGINRLITALELDLQARGVQIHRNATVRRISRGPGGVYELEAGPVPAPTMLSICATSAP